MKRHKLIPLIFLLTILVITLANVSITLGGWRTDTTGDSDDPYTDIVKLEISQTILKITLDEAPVLDEAEATIYTYNIWVDTSNEDTNPDTETWDPDHEIYEYLAHFKWYYSSGQWYNDSYLWAYNYYTDESYNQHEGRWYWDKQASSWSSTEVDQEIAIISGNTISFNVDGAIYREEPLGSGNVVQGVANAGSNLYIDDIAPNSGWVDEFDNMCGPQPTGSNTTNPLPNISFLFSIVFLAIIAANVRIIRNRQK